MEIEIPCQVIEIQDSGALNATVSTRVDRELTMTNERTFLIQRYAGGNWPQLKGEVPFLATGPSFFKWCFKGSLEKYGEHRFVENFARDFQEAFGDEGEWASRYMTAWALLETGVVQALWMEHSEIPVENRWEASVTQLAHEIPGSSLLKDDLIEYLSGLSDASHFRTYVAEDHVALVPLLIP